MLKRLNWYPWLLALLVAGILTCIVLIFILLWQNVPQITITPGTRLVREAIGYAHV